MKKDAEYYQRKISLTPEQRKAWTQLVRAINRCKKEKIFFYQVLEHLGGLNGHNVHTVEGDSDKDHQDKTCDSPSCLQYKNFPSVVTACSFADDNHFIVLKDE